MPGVSMIHPPSRVGQGQHDRGRRGVPTAPGDGVHVPDLAVGVRHQRVDEGGLAHAAVTEEHAGAALQPVAQLRQVAALVGDHPRHPERPVGHQQRLGVGQVRLGEAEQGLHPGDVRRHQRAVDQPGARLGVGEGADDDELVGVRHEDPLDGVVVVRAAAQHRAAVGDLDDAGQAPVVAGHVADDAHPVADDHGLAAERSRLHRGDRLPVDEQAEPTAVDREDQAVACVVVRRPLLGARSGAPPRALVVLLVLLAVAALARAHDRPVTAAEPTRRGSRGRSWRWWRRPRRGRRRRPSRPRRPAWAIRWSA